MMTMVENMSITQIIDTDLVVAVFQPVVDLDTGQIVAVEALARGPRGSDWESPAVLFGAAADQGVVAELDWACRAAAVNAALEWGLPREIRLFINAEPSSLMTPCPPQHLETLRIGLEELSIVVEVTERDLAAKPALLLAALEELRRLGLGIAIDDVGADPMSLAFMPFVRPDVIKLDMSLVQQPLGPNGAAVAAAVSADAERRGAVVLAEGIETEEHRRAATVLGASLGQGWMFGRPRPLDDIGPDLATRSDEHIPRLALAPTDRDTTPMSPWDMVAQSRRRRTTTKRLLMPMSRHIEQASTLSIDSVVLGAFQDRKFFTPATARRYDRIAESCGFVAAIAAGMPPSPGSVRYGDLDPEHPLAKEWTVVVVGPHFAGALIARELPGSEPDADRRFDYVITHDRDIVTLAARSLLQHVVPQATR